MFFKKTPLDGRTEALRDENPFWGGRRGGKVGRCKVAPKARRGAINLPRCSAPLRRRLIYYRFM